MRTEVYRWRVSADLKARLERDANRRKISLPAVLDLAARDWLNKGGSEVSDSDEQLRLQKSAAECIGAFAGNDAHRSENVRRTVRQQLR